MKPNLAIALFAAGCAILVGVAGFARPALAHEWQTDGSISVLLHTDPDDTPVAGQPATIFVNVTDAAGRFAVKDCTCYLNVIRDGRVAMSELLDPAAAKSAGLFQFEAPVTFIDAGAYSVVIDGVPQSPKDFQAFSVTFDEKVEPDRSSDPSPAVLIFAFVIAAALYFSYREIASWKKKNRAS